MGLFTIIGNLLGRKDENSKSAAKDRLRLVLMHDRSDIPATMMEAIRTEMVQVLNKYVEIDQEALEVMLEKEAGSIGLVLNIPIRRVKSEAEAAEALAAMQQIQDAKDGKEPEAPAEAAEETIPVIIEAKGAGNGNNKGSNKEKGKKSESKSESKETEAATAD